MTGEELAWVAGFLEGEGFFWIQRSKKGFYRLGLGVTSTDKDVLERLQHLIPGSRIQGPYKQHGLGTKPHCRWVLGMRGPAVQLLKELRPLMGQRRAARIDELLECHALHPLQVTGRRQSIFDHGSRAMYRRGCRCAKCRAEEAGAQWEFRKGRRERALAS